MHQYKIIKNIHRTLSLSPSLLLFPNKLHSYVEKGFVEEKYLQPTLENEVNFITLKEARPMGSMQTNPLEETVMWHGETAKRGTTNNHATNDQQRQK